jgi:hypothetical protein
MKETLAYCDACLDPKNNRELTPRKTLATVHTKTFVGFIDSPMELGIEGNMIKGPEEAWADIDLCSYHAGFFLIEIQKKLQLEDRRQVPQMFGYNGMYF